MQGKKNLIGRILGILLFIAILVGIIWAIYKIYNNPQKRLTAKLNEAHTYLYNQEFDKAENAYLEAIGIMPEDTESYLKLAEIYVEGKRYEDALEILNKGYSLTYDSTVANRIVEIEAILNTISEEQKLIEEIDRARAEEFRISSSRKEVTFGCYEQDNNPDNGCEPIEWKVLCEEDNKFLIISKYVLDCQPFNQKYTDVSWQDSTIRTFLNDTFLNSAFTDDEKKRILTTKIEVAPYDNITPQYVEDSVFLLSAAEVEKYRNDEITGIDSYWIVSPTEYAKSKGIWIFNDDLYDSRIKAGEIPALETRGATQWWLRDNGGAANFAMDFTATGEIRKYGHDVGSLKDGVRPALWIYTE